MRAAALESKAVGTFLDKLGVWGATEHNAELGTNRYSVNGIPVGCG